MEDINNLDISLAIVWRGKISTIDKVKEVLKEAGAYIVYVEKSTKKLFIKRQSESNDYYS